MTQSEFKLLFADQVMKCEETLQNKRKEYTGDNQDRLSSFKVAASLQGCTPQRAFKKELWDEKITDSLNYLFLLAAIIREEAAFEQN